MRRGFCSSSYLTLGVSLGILGNMYCLSCGMRTNLDRLAGHCNTPACVPDDWEIIYSISAFPSASKSSVFFPDSSQYCSLCIAHGCAQGLDALAIIRIHLSDLDDGPQTRREGVSHSFAQLSVQDQNTEVVQDLMYMLADLDSKLARFINKLWRSILLPPVTRRV